MTNVHIFHFEKIIVCHEIDTCNFHGNCSEDGFCECNERYAGTNCNECDVDYYNYPICTRKLPYTYTTNKYIYSPYIIFMNLYIISCWNNTDCTPADNCNDHGTCNQLGNCECNTGYTGEECDECDDAYYNYPVCKCK